MDLGLSPPDCKLMRHNHDIINPGKKSRELLEYYSGNCSELFRIVGQDCYFRRTTRNAS